MKKQQTKIRVRGKDNAQSRTLAVEGFLLEDGFGIGISPKQYKRVLVACCPASSLQTAAECVQWEAEGWVCTCDPNYYSNSDTVRLTPIKRLI